MKRFAIRRTGIAALFVAAGAIGALGSTAAFAGDPPGPRGHVEALTDIEQRMVELDPGPKIVCTPIYFDFCFEWGLSGGTGPCPPPKKIGENCVEVP